MKKSKRQEHWKKLGYTQEQIDNHLSYERYRAKIYRERAKKNNEKNAEIIKQVKNDLIGLEIKTNNCDIKILSLRETNDGEGFWFKCRKVFKDGSSGEFREFFGFDEYSKKEFIKCLKI